MWPPRRLAAVWMAAASALGGAAFSACTMDFGALEPTGAGGSDATVPSESGGPDVVPGDGASTDGGSYADVTVDAGKDVAADSYVSDGAGDGAPDAGADVVDSGACGAPTQPCCAGNHCNGTACCDTNDNVCFANDTTCSQSSTVCRGGACVACGGTLRACCAGSTCNGSECCDVTTCVGNGAFCLITGGGTKCQQKTCQ